MNKLKEKKISASRNNINYGNHWFKRFVRDCKKISPHIHFKRIKLGYVRISWKGGGEGAYLGECYKIMPPKGYDWYDIDPRLESRSYYEEFEDQVEMTRKIKNFVEGYADNLDQIKTRVYQMKHSKEFYKTVVDGYKQMRVV